MAKSRGYTVYGCHLPKRLCAYKKCRKEFQPKNGSQRFCSNACKEIHYFELKNGEVKGKVYKTIKLRNGLEVLDNAFGLEISGLK